MQAGGYEVEFKELDFIINYDIKYRVGRVAQAERA